MEILGYIAAIAIGITLGLIGGGGSILTVPILVYLFRINPELATSYSLFIVGITASIGSIKQYLLQLLKLKEAIYFAVPSVLSLLLVRKLVLPSIPDNLWPLGDLMITKNMFIMLIFAVLMLLASRAMIYGQPKTNKKEPNYFKLGGIGLGVGLVTGFLGAGGGFLIIPALLFFAGIPIKQAVGTSLFIIALNSLIGFTGDIISGVKLDYPFLLSITGIAVIGMFIGMAISKKIDGAKLKPAFGWFVLAMGIFIVVKEIWLS